MGLTVLVAVPEEQGTVPAIERIDPDPGHEGECRELSGNVDAHPRSGTTKFQRLFHPGPATIHFLCHNHRAVEFTIARLGQVGDQLLPLGAIKGVVSDETIVFRQGVAMRLPEFEIGLALAIGLAPHAIRIRIVHHACGYRFRATI